MVFAPLRVGNAFPNLSPSRPVVVIPNLGAQFEISSTALFFTSSNLNWKRVTSCYIGGNLLNTIKHLNSHESNLKKKKSVFIQHPCSTTAHHHIPPSSSIQCHPRWGPWMAHERPWPAATSRPGSGRSSPRSTWWTRGPLGRTWPGTGRDGSRRRVGQM